jgi:hypothetical protein
MQVPRQLHAGFRISGENGDGTLSDAVDGTLQSVILSDTLIGGERFGWPGAFTLLMHNLASDSMGRNLFGVRHTGRSGITGIKKQSSGSFGGSVNGALVGPRF